MNQTRNGRQAARHSLEAEIELGDGYQGGELGFDSHNASEGGLFLKSELLLEVGETFWISFILPGTEMDRS